jgi:hypothetical protein
MKIAIAFAALVASAGAFAPQAGRVASRQATLVLKDSLVEEALAATKKFGATSPEARVLWDAVEEMRAAESHSGSPMGGMDKECDVEDVDDACKEYDSKVAQLQELMEQYNDKLTKMKTLTKDLSNLKLTVSSAKAEPKKENPALRAAMAEAISAAKSATSQHGADSTEAKLAWETVEEVASSGLANAMGGRMDQECLVEQATEACKALEELQEALLSEK